MYDRQVRSGHRDLPARADPRSQLRRPAVAHGRLRAEVLGRLQAKPRGGQRQREVAVGIAPHAQRQVCALLRQRMLQLRHLGGRRQRLQDRRGRPADYQLPEVPRVPDPQGPVGHSRLLDLDRHPAQLPDHLAAGQLRDCVQDWFRVQRPGRRQGRVAVPRTVEGRQLQGGVRTGFDLRGPDFARRRIDLPAREGRGQAQDQRHRRLGLDQDRQEHGRQVGARADHARGRWGSPCGVSGFRRRRAEEQLRRHLPRRRARANPGNQGGQPVRQQDPVRRRQAWLHQQRLRAVRQPGRQRPLLLRQDCSLLRRRNRLRGRQQLHARRLQDRRRRDQGHLHQHPGLGQRPVLPAGEPVRRRLHHRHQRLETAGRQLDQQRELEGQSELQERRVPVLRQHDVQQLRRWPDRAQGDDLQQTDRSATGDDL